MYGRNIGMKMLIQIQNWEYKLYTNTNGRRRVYTNMNVNMNTRIQVNNNINIIIWIYVGWPCWKWFGFWMAWTSILLAKRRILLTGGKRASLQEIWIDKFLAGGLTIFPININYSMYCLSGYVSQREVNLLSFAIKFTSKYKNRYKYEYKCLSLWRRCGANPTLFNCNQCPIICWK